MTPYTPALLGVVALCLGMILLGWTRRRTPLVVPYIVVNAAIVVWTVAYVWEFEATTAARMILATQVQYIGVVTIPPAALAFALLFTGRPGYVNVRSVAAAALIPMATIALVWTNGAHGWMFSDFRVVQGSGSSVLDVSRGGFFWVFVGFSYTCLTAAAALVAQMAFRSTGVWRNQAILVLIGMMTPFLANVARITGLGPATPLDLTVFGFTIEAVALGFAALNMGLLAIVPVARDRVVGQIDVGILVVDRRGLAVDLNRAGREILGVVGDVVGKDAAPLLGPFADVLTGEDPSLNVTVPGPDPDTSRTFACSRVGVSDRRDEIIGRALVMRDITELADAHRAVVEARDQLEERVKERTAELEEANRQLRSEIRQRLDAQEKERGLRDQLARSQRMESVGRLAGGIAHDFNNLLAAVLGFAELAIEDVDEGSGAHVNLREVISAGDRARDLVGQLLDFARLTDGSRQAIRPDALVEKALRAIRPAMAESIRIRTVVPDDLPPLLGDPAQLEQVMIQLLDNAARAVDGDGTITVAASAGPPGLDGDVGPIRPGGWVELAVSDTGSGMDPETKSRAFEPFFTTNDQVLYRGLGLAVVHGIVTAHRGSVTIDSQPEEGTTVTVHLPAAD